MDCLETWDTFNVKGFLKKLSSNHIRVEYAGNDHFHIPYKTLNS